MPRGGKRPGAGGKKGNMNAFRHGRYSGQLDILAEALVRVPELREALAAAGRARRRQEREARRTAATILHVLMEGAPPPPQALRKLGNNQELFILFVNRLISGLAQMKKERSEPLFARGKRSNGPPPSEPSP